MRVGVVIPSLSLPPSLEELFRSLAAQTQVVHEIVLVSQSTQPPPAFLAVWQERLPLRVIEARPGAARARNAGIDALGPCDVLAMPDDDVWYQDDAVATMCAGLAQGHGALSGRLVPWQENRAHFLGPRAVLDSRSVWRNAIEATMAFRREFFETTGGFDPQLGVGAGTPWGAGEGTDLLLRGMAAGFSVLYDPAIVVSEGPTPIRTVTEHRRRLRSYARGTGRVIARHESASRSALAVAGPIARSARQLLRTDLGGSRDQLAVAAGRFEGVTGRLFSRENRHG